jgi:hypothetical protein
MFDPVLNSFKHFYYALETLGVKLPALKGGACREHPVKKRRLFDND